MMIWCTAHQDRVTCVQFSPVHEFVLSCSRDKYFEWHCSQTGRRLGGYLASAWTTCLQYLCSFMCCMWLLRELLNTWMVKLLSVLFDYFCYIFLCIYLIFNPLLILCKQSVCKICRQYIYRILCLTLEF